jgi:ABC-type phosphate transport system substrate-binding protein
MRGDRIPVLVTAALVGLSTLSIAGGAAAAPTAGTAAGNPDATSFAVAAHAASHSKTVERVNRVNGKDVVVDKRHVTVHVNDTGNLRGRQEINVSWTGAHPTGGIIADQNSIDAQQEEYPVVLLECRGVDSTHVAAAKRLSPQTCWTQSWSERFQSSLDTAFPPYRLDRFASQAQRAAIVGAPKHRPTACFAPLPSEYWVPFVSANGHTYPGGTGGCAGMAPEAASTEGSALPSNETFGVTARNGRGSAKFDVWTSAENASLGCSTTVACSLVAVPIEGISCDPAARSLPAKDRPKARQLAAVTAGCEAKGAFAAGQTVVPQGGDDVAVSGSLWWSESNWRNRITVPLSFATPADACDVVNASSSVNVYGSELLSQATGQWLPHFCLNSHLFKIQHVQIGEPEARNLLTTGGASAAFTSSAPPAGYGKPVVQAPTALTGFAITYDIDNSRGQPYQQLRLTPRLLAKLLTESYPAILSLKQLDPALAGNPLDITDDPEFIALNPGITHGVTATEAASELLSLSSDSDVIRALTTYITNDPTARAWLNGTPDPWGMTVNPKYAHIKLPVDKWPLLDTFASPELYTPTSNDCLHSNPVPFLPLVAAPMSTLAEIAESMQFAVANSQTTCVQPVDGSSVGEKLVASGRQTVGNRFMIGISSLGDADRYELNQAALQTTPNHFVTPTAASLHSAASFLRPDSAAGTWTLPYRTLRTNAKAAAAYPGTMLVSTAVPTTGLPAKVAKDYATFLRFVAGPGQQPGEGIGQLPAGYLPITASNGVGQLATYSQVAAQAVAEQNGKQPALNAKFTPITHSRSGTGTGNGSGGNGDSTGSGGNGDVPPAGGTDGLTPPAVGTSAPGDPGNGNSPVVAANVSNASTGHTLGIPLGPGALTIVVLLGLAVIGGLTGPGTYLFGRWKGRW